MSLPSRDQEMDALKEIFNDLGFSTEKKHVELPRDEVEIKRQRRKYWNWAELDYDQGIDTDPMTYHYPHLDDEDLWNPLEEEGRRW